MTPMYYRGASAAILVYDITNKESFESVKGWANELEQQLTESIIITIAGNKSDLADQQQVKKADAVIYAEGIEAALFEISAKQDKGLEELFLHISQRLIFGNKTRQTDANTTDITKTQTTPPKSDCLSSC